MDLKIRCKTALMIFLVSAGLIQAAEFPPGSVEAILQSDNFSLARERVPAPDFQLNTIGKNQTGKTESGQTSLSAYKGKVVLIKFWAVWCVPCRIDLPQVQSLYKKLGNDKFEIVAVNEGEKREKVSAFVGDLGLTFPVALDLDGRVGTIYDVQAIPSSFIVDKEGRLVARLVGSKKAKSKALQEALKKLIAE